LLALVQKLREIFLHWWSEFTLQTKLMAAATLVVSLVMSGLTFWAVNAIQQDARINDTRFGSDLGLLLAANAAPMIAEDHLSDLARFSSRFFQSTSSVRYILYADRDGDIFFGIPYSAAEVQNSLTIKRRIELPENYTNNLEIPIVRQHRTPAGQVTDVFVPLNHEGTYLGVLAIGINPNATVVASSNLTRDVTIAVFISIWSMVILGAVFNALTITKPIKELLVKNIAAKNFQQRIDLPLGGELGELIQSFNEMAERLERYEEQNIEELTSEKAKLETLVTTIADGAILIDTNLQIILVNPTAKKMFDWEQKNVIGKNILHNLPVELTTKLTKILYQIAAGEIKDKNTIEESDRSNNLEDLDSKDFHFLVREEFRIALEKPKGRTFRILLSQVLDRDRENVRGVAMTIQDVTKEAELNEAKSQFISNVSHELRTPLFNIKSFIETLFEYGEELSQEQRLNFLETANHETDRLTRLVNDVLDLSKLESGKTYNFCPVDIGSVVEQTLRTYQLNAKDKGIELEQKVEPCLPPVMSNYDLLLQVLTNLVGNALKFTKSGGKVTILASKAPSDSDSSASEDRIRIAVRDTGIGIALEDKHAIFDRFFRVENRVHTLEGTGLGLSIVKNIVEKHNSKIDIESEVGVGTTFWFDLEIYRETKDLTPA
jgi:two-component system, OmpR family, sensor histidine kinase NblS